MSTWVSRSRTRTPCRNRRPKARRDFPSARQVHWPLRLPFLNFSIAMLPEMSPLQFVVVQLLFAGPQSGGQLRRRMEQAGVKIGPPSFSRLMLRMETAGYLQAHDEDGPAGCHLVRPRRFEVTDLGVAIWSRVREFYAGWSPPPPELVPIATAEGQLAHLPPKARRSILRRRIRRQCERIVNRAVAGSQNRMIGPLGRSLPMSDAHITRAMPGPGRIVAPLGQPNHAVAWKKNPTAKLAPKGSTSRRRSCKSDILPERLPRRPARISSSPPKVRTNTSKRGAGKVKIRQQGVDAAKLVGWADKQIGVAGERLQRPFRGGRFQQPDRSGPDGHNPSAVARQR